MVVAGLAPRILRGGAVVARQAHNLEVVGSNPTPATRTFVFEERYPHKESFSLRFNLNLCYSVYMAKSDKKLIAMKLRRKGLSINKISSHLSVAKSTASLWCKDIILSEDQKRILRSNSIKAGHRGRIIGAEQNRIKKQNLVHILREKARIQVGSLSARDILIGGIALYWAEGSKSDTTSGFVFINSDPVMVLFMTRFLVDVLQVSKINIVCSIQINRIHQNRIRSILKFWSSLLQLPLAQFTKPYYIDVTPRKRYSNHLEYQGILRLKVRKSSGLKYYMIELIKSFKECDTVFYKSR